MNRVSEGRDDGWEVITTHPPELKHCRRDVILELKV